MTKRELTITMRAKNALAAGLGKAHASLKKFGQSALGIGGLFAKGFLVAGTAVAGFAAKALAAYSKQEEAEKSLVAAMNAHGEAGERLLPMLKQQASAIQDETGAADEATLASMARMRMLGVQVDKLEEAAKAEQALAAVGLKGESAQRAVALAMQGNYDMLNRYIPSIRDANTEQEKAAAFNSLVEKGYKQQKDTLNTVSGRWKELKGRLGDVWEQFGAVIQRSTGTNDILATVSDKVKQFGQSIQKWADAGGIVNLIATIKNFGAESKKTFSLVGNTAKIVWASISDGVESTANYVVGLVKAWINVNIADFNLLKDRAIAVWEKIKHPFSKMPEVDTSEYEAAIKEMGKAVRGEGALVTRRTEEALAERQKIHDEYSKEIKLIAKEQSKALIKEAEEQTEEIKKIEADAIAHTIAAEEEKSKRIAQWRKQDAERRKKEINKELAGLDKVKAKLEEQAKMKVDDFIAREREEKAEKERIADEEKRRTRLEAKLERGIKLTRKDREWLDAFKAIEQAGQGAQVVAQKQKDLRDQLAEMDNKSLQSIDGNIADIKRQNEQLLTF